jgi:hypothetical protein
VPFDIRPIWYQIDRENRETRMRKSDPATACEIDAGSVDDLRPSQFQPYNPASQAPDKGPLYGSYGVTPDLLRLGLLDPRLRFFQEPTGDPHGDDPLVAVVQQWLGGDKPISVLDFSGVPSRASDLAIGVVLNLLFEVALRGEYGRPGIGRPGPVLIVLEEAHRYLGDAASELTRASANRIAREGRKYGVGLMLVTQRPTELPKTSLAPVAEDGRSDRQRGGCCVAHTHLDRPPGSAAIGRGSVAQAPDRGRDGREHPRTQLLGRMRWQ